MASAVNLVRRFRTLHALVIGDAMLDTYFEGTTSRICNEGPVPVVRKTAEHRAPGGAANAASNLRALGAEVTFLGVVGGDTAGAQLRAALRGFDLDDSTLVEDPDGTTLHKMRILADGQYVVRFDEDGARELGRDIELEMVSRLRQRFALCDLVLVSDYAYGAVCDLLLDHLRALRADRPCPLIVDSKLLHRYKTMRATVVTPNLVEARLLVERGQRADASTTDGHVALEETEQLGRAVLDQLDAEYAAITLAADGVFLIDRQGHTAHLPTHQVAHANVAGAGDSFAAALALALTAGADILESAQIALDVAALAVTKRWTSVVHHQELLQRVSLRDHTMKPHPRVPATEASARQALSRTMAALAAKRKAGRTIVFTNGVFDILHAGHVEFLRKAKALGDVLVVGVNSDRGARALKGQLRPINSERDRMALVEALEPVDHVVLFDDETPEALIRALRPDIHVKGGDYEGEPLPEGEAVREVGGRIMILPLVGSLSTSGVIDRIVSLVSDGEGGAQL